MQKRLAAFIVAGCLCFGGHAAGAEPLGDVVAGYDDTRQYIQDSFDAATSGVEVIFKYEPHETFKIYCQDGFVTDVRFAPGETITYVGAGDSTRWIVDKAQAGSPMGMVEHLYIKPLKRGLNTNIVVNTNERTYQITAVSGGQYNPIVSWSVEQDRLEAVNRQRREDAFMNVNAQALHFDYTFDKHGYSWSPEVVFDDGHRTFIRMKKEMRDTVAPAFFIIGKKGEMVLTNYRVVRGYYVIDRLFDRAQLVVGSTKIKIKRK